MSSVLMKRTLRLLAPLRSAGARWAPGLVRVDPPSAVAAAGAASALSRNLRRLIPLPLLVSLISLSATRFTAPSSVSRRTDDSA
jgi:hypothetical protein